VAEWVKACKGSANTAYPYGASYDATKCNGRAYDTDPLAAGDQDSVLATDQPSTCVSTWTGVGTVLNMSGNLKEWTATALSGGKPTDYEIRGGAYDTPSIDTFGNGLSCDYQLPAPGTSLQLPTLGFRCCK
jgi:formylglycine-generating enzyme required for sulfatase activity